MAQSAEGGLFLRGGKTEFSASRFVSTVSNPTCRHAIANYETHSADLLVSQRVVPSHFSADFFLRRFQGFRATRMPRSILSRAACVYSAG